MKKKKSIKPAEDISESAKKKVIVKSRQEFLNMKKYLQDCGKSFMYSHSGSIDSIIFEGAELFSVNLQVSGGKGHHLSRRFKSDIDDWLKARGGKMPVYQRDYKEQMFNLDGIEKLIGKPALGVDVDDCYWRTAHLLGYITNETYIIGLKKKEWKIGRNACIGSLQKSKMMVPYVNGKPNYAGKNIVPSRLEYQYVRNHIIGHIYNLFFRLYRELGDKFCMFLTDCIFTDYQSRKYVQDYFLAHGYRSKVHPITFTGLDRGKKKVSWYDFAAKNDAPSAKFPGVDKYYLYSYAQVIDGVAESMMANNDSFLSSK